MKFCSFYLQKSQAPCSIEIECCGDTCQKLLACGTHICAQRCHKGDCSQVSFYELYMYIKIL